MMYPVTMSEADSLVTLRGRQIEVHRVRNQRPEMGEWAYLATELPLAWRVAVRGCYDLVAIRRHFATTHHPSIATVRVPLGASVEADLQTAEIALFDAHTCIAASMPGQNRLAL